MSVPETPVEPHTAGLGSGRILVTGALGHVGREVVHAAVARGATVCCGDLSVDRIHSMHGDLVDARRLDFHDPSTFEPAVLGCKALFLVRPPNVASMEATLLPFIDVALARGVGHIVFLSAFGAATNKLVPHHAVEQHLAARGASFTLLRPGFFAQNLGAAYREDIAEDGRLFLPAGRGRVAFVDIRDVAELAAMILESPDAHRGQAYTCTGPEAFSFEEAARLMTDVIRRPIRYECASLAGYVRHLHVRGLPLAQIAVQTVLHVGLRFGHGQKIDPTLQRLLGRKPRTLATYVRESAELWAAPERPVRVSLPAEPTPLPISWPPRAPVV